ncbi:recombination directionality factor [Streptomyces lavendulae]|uniref:recombination directionality factor n=1 Tax=Streptomyces lavendulae TaxID=1914 RepID=UPI0036BA91AC
MPLDIWTTDPENKPKARETYADDTVGRLHSGYMEFDEKTKKNRPVALSEWRFSTGERTVADAVAQLFGGTPVENEESTSENFIDVFTPAAKIPVIIGPGGIESDMKQWVNGKLVHHCTGTTFLSHRDESMIGQPCGCPRLFAERKQLANDYMGPNPSITVTFSLADDPELGQFKYQTGSWTLAKVLHEAEDALERLGAGGSVFAFLELEYVEFVLTKGKDRGQTVSYTKPVIKVVKSHNDAIADES